MFYFQSVEIERILVNESKFPSEFKTVFNGFGQDFEFDFVKDSNEDYGSLYVINSDTGEAEEYNGSYKVFKTKFKILCLNNFLINSINQGYCIL